MLSPLHVPLPVQISARQQLHRIAADVMVQADQPSILVSFIILHQLCLQASEYVRHETVQLPGVSPFGTAWY